MVHVEEEPVFDGLAEAWFILERAQLVEDEALAWGGGGGGTGSQNVGSGMDLATKHQNDKKK